MARTYGRLLCSAWDNDDLLALTSDAKVLYFALSSQQDTSAAGVLPITPRRWRKWLNDDAVRTDAALDELIATRFVIVDDDTAEVCVRTFIRHDGRLDNRNMVTGIRNSIAAIRSTAIRDACETLLENLLVERRSDGVPTGLRTQPEQPAAKQPAADILSSGSRSSREPRPDIADETTTLHDLPPAAAAAIALLIDHRVTNEAKRNPHGLRRSLQANVPAEVAPALLARLERCPNATTDELATKVLGLTELDLHRLRS